MQNPNKLTIITAPNNFNIKGKKLFLAGSIEQGKAINWQKAVIKKLENTKWIILNPRRDHWNKLWASSIKNKKFEQQVKWELNAQEKADKILMVFDPKTLSPISLLELGLFAKSGKMIVVCPKHFWRKSNIDIVCRKYKIPIFENINEGIKLLNDQHSK